MVIVQEMMVILLLQVEDRMQKIEDLVIPVSRRDELGRDRIENGEIKEIHYRIQ